MVFLSQIMAHRFPNSHGRMPFPMTYDFRLAACPERGVLQPRIRDYVDNHGTDFYQQILEAEGGSAEALEKKAFASPRRGRHMSLELLEKSAGRDIGSGRKYEAHTSGIEPGALARALTESLSPEKKKVLQEGSSPIAEALQEAQRMVHLDDKYAAREDEHKYREIKPGGGARLSPQKKKLAERLGRSVMGEWAEDFDPAAALPEEILERTREKARRWRGDDDLDKVEGVYTLAMTDGDLGKNKRTRRGKPQVLNKSPRENRLPLKNNQLSRNPAMLFYENEDGEEVEGPDPDQVSSASSGDVWRRETVQKRVAFLNVEEGEATQSI